MHFILLTLAQLKHGTDEKKSHCTSLQPEIQILDVLLAFYLRLGLALLSLPLIG